MSKELILGTALWGWTVSKKTCFSLLDHFYEEGFRTIDTAKNYPINGDKTQFLFSENTIAEWVDSNGISDLKIICKIGSVSNEMTPDNNLSRSYINFEINRLSELYELNLDTIMVHWDNRDLEQDIYDSLKEITHSGYKLGLSGIKYPETYLSAIEHLTFNEPISIEIKYNFLERKSLEYYSLLKKIKPLFYAYGISVSGLKMHKNEYEDDSYVKVARPDNYHAMYMNDHLKKNLESLLSKYPFAKNIYGLGIMFSESNPDLSGYIVGPNSVERLQHIIEVKNESSFGRVTQSEFDSLAIN